MVFRPVRKEALDIKKSAVGTVYIGTLKSKKEITTSNGPCALWEFEDEDGKTFAIWGFTSLDNQLGTVELESLCRITFQGQAPTKNKYGKFPYRVKVEFDDGIVEDKDGKEITL